MNITRIRKVVDSLLWGVLTLLMAFIFTIKLPPYIGVIVFVGLFFVSVAFFRKALTEWRNPSNGSPEDCTD